MVFFMTIDFYLAGLPKALGKVCAMFSGVSDTSWSSRLWTNGWVHMIKPNNVVEPRSQV